MKNIIDRLGINEKYTKPIRRPKVFTNVYDSVPHVGNFNYMADLVVLPETDDGFKYLLVVVDLGNDNFDIEPIKDKEAQTVLNAMLKMFKREYIKKPQVSIQTDNGKEFHDVFHKWCEDNKVLHHYALPNRHSQMSNVESLNRQLGRLLNGYCNEKEIKTGEPYLEWTDIIDTVRKELNDYRDREDGDVSKDVYPTLLPGEDPKFKKGDLVIRQLDKPENALGHPLKGTHREGDYNWKHREPREIVKVIPFGGMVPYRYLLKGIPEATFTDQQLMLAEDQSEGSKYTFERVLDKRQRNKLNEFLIKWKGELVKDATWEKEAQLREDGLGAELDGFKKKKKKR